MTFGSSRHLNQRVRAQGRKLTTLVFEDKIRTVMMLPDQNMIRIMIRIVRQTNIRLWSETSMCAVSTVAGHWVIDSRPLAREREQVIVVTKVGNILPLVLLHVLLTKLSCRPVHAQKKTVLAQAQIPQHSKSSLAHHPRRHTKKGN